jgi:two-component system nitrate/nitrite sensor histidine kinase NarX
MRLPRTLAFKLAATGLTLLLLTLSSIGLTLWVTWQLEGGAAAVNEAGRMRMMSYRLALDAPAADRDAIAARLVAMDDTLELLTTGDPSRPLFVPWDERTREAFSLMRDHWTGLRARWQAGQPPVPQADVDRQVALVDAFVSSIEQRLSQWTDVLRLVQLTLVGLAIGAAVLLSYAVHLTVLDPLRRLGQGMHALRGGDFGARVQLSASEEFAQLADGFNLMATRLAEMYGDLESRVQEKTARLEVKRERLAALYDVSAFVAQADTLDELARGFVSRVRRIARADAAAVRWADDNNERYLMLAQEGLPPSFAQLEQCLPSGSCHCGQRAGTAHTRVIAIRPLDRASLGHCGRAGFTTLLTVPVSLHHRLLGEVELFFRDAHALDDEDRSLIETLASHLAGGIESLRASAADREAAIAGERALLARELHDSIAQSLAFLKIQVDLMRGALRRGDQAAVARTLEEVDTGVRESYADVRELLLHFRTRTDAQDIESALRSTLQKFEQQTGLAAELRIEGHGVPLPADVQVQVLHVLQEALSNVRKHSGATTVRVLVQATPEWRFEVVDDGRGFDVGVRPDSTHVGLNIMRERAARIGARVALRSDPGQGTRVTLTVPQEEVAKEPT